MTESIAGFVNEWQAAEERLYPILMAQSDRYELYVHLVRQVADELRFARTAQELASAYAGGSEIAHAVVQRQGASSQEISLEILAGAAFALRYREILAEVSREEAVRRIQAARARGDRWVVLHETSGAAGPAMPPYRRLEMHIPDGVGVHVFVELSPGMDEVLYCLDLVQLDPATGAWVGQGQPIEHATFTEKEPWEAAVRDVLSRYTYSP